MLISNKIHYFRNFRIQKYTFVTCRFNGNKKIKSVKQHLVLVKENKDGSKEFNVYMSIDEAKAKKAREEAALAAKKQAALGVLSQQVEEFIGEPVEAE